MSIIFNAMQTTKTSKSKIFGEAMPCLALPLIKSAYDPHISSSEIIRYYNTLQQMSTTVMLKSKSELEIIPTKLESKLKIVSSELNFKNSRHFHVYSDRNRLSWVWWL